MLHAWSHVFSAPGAAFSQAWDVAASAYSAMFEGAIINPHTISAAFHGGSTAAIFNPLSETAVNATPLILAGLAVALAFRAGLFNIGATGQFIGGAMIAGWIGFAVHLPDSHPRRRRRHRRLCRRGHRRVFRRGPEGPHGAHEVIVTIMLNYVMEFLLLFLLGLTVFRAAGSTEPDQPAASLNNAMLAPSRWANLRINAGFLSRWRPRAAVAWLLSRTTLGFELRTVGANQNAARAAGMSPETDLGHASCSSAGGLAGLAGASVVLGTDFALTPQIYGTYGIDAITVALLGRAKPGGVVLAALLYGSLNAGERDHAGPDPDPCRHRHGHPGADRALRGGAAVCPGGLPPPGAARRGGGATAREGVELMTAMTLVGQQRFAFDRQTGHRHDLRDARPRRHLRVRPVLQRRLGVHLHPQRCRRLVPNLVWPPPPCATDWAPSPSSSALSMQG